MTQPSPAPIPPTTPLRPNVPLAVGCTLASAALCVDQLWLWSQARNAEVAHLISLPLVWFWAPALVAVLAAGAVGVAAPMMGREPRLSRVPLLVLVLLAFLDALVLPDVRSATSRFDALADVSFFAETAQGDAVDIGHLPSSEAELAHVVGQMPPPQFLIRGEKLPHWTLKFINHCTGPHVELGGEPAGTYFYCLAEDGNTAWITGVGRTSTSFGPPEILASDGKPVIAPLKAEAAPTP